MLGLGAILGVLQKCLFSARISQDGPISEAIFSLISYSDSSHVLVQSKLDVSEFLYTGTFLI
jgi:hypothetical protein